MKTDDGRVYVFLALFCFLLYGGTLSYSLSWLDDYFLLIEARPFLSSLKNLPALFFTDAFITNPIGLYRPMLNVSFMWDTLLDGIAGGWFFTHLNNILLHIASVCLFYRFLRIFSFKTKTAAIMSLIFAAHPAASVAVGWIPGRNDTLLALSSFPAIVLADKYCRTGRIRNAALYGLMLSFAVFAKESAVFLPVLAFLWLFLCNSGEIFAKKNEFKDRINVFVLFSIVPLLAWAGMRSLAYVGSTHIGILATLRNMAYMPVLLGRALFPAWPVLMSPYDMLPYKAFSAVIGISFLLYVAVFLSKMLKKDCSLENNVNKIPEDDCVFVQNVDKSAEKLRFRTAVFGISWFLLFFMPTLVAGDGIVSGTLYFDHRLYVPMAGLIVSVAAIIPKIAEKRRIFAISSVAVFILFLSAVSFCHLGNYENRYVFWQRAVQDSPADFSNFVRAGQFEEQRGLDGQAEYFYIRAIEMNPAQSMLHASLAGIYYRRGNYAAAEAAMQSELQISPDCQKCHDWLAALRKQKLAIGN